MKYKIMLSPGKIKLYKRGDNMELHGDVWYIKQSMDGSLTGSF